MAVDHNTRLVRQFNGKDAPSQTPDVEIRQGHVESVQSDGTATITVGGDPEPIAEVHSDSNYVPKAGDTVWVEVADTEMTILRKNGTSPAAFSGVRYAATATSEKGPTGSVYGDCASGAGPSVSVMVGDSGNLKVTISATFTISDTSDGGRMSVALSGANSVAASDAQCLSCFPKINGFYMSASRVLYYTGLTPGLTTVTAKYKDDGADNLYSFRELLAEPM